jgi:hypothetical protein
MLKFELEKKKTKDEFQRRDKRLIVTVSLKNWKINTLWNIPTCWFNSCINLYQLSLLKSKNHVMNHSDTRIISNMLQLTYQSFSQNWSINYKSSSLTIDPPMGCIGKSIAKWLKLNQSGIWSVFGRLLIFFRSRRKKSVSFRGGFRWENQSSDKFV